MANLINDNSEKLQYFFKQHDFNFNPGTVLEIDNPKHFSKSDFFTVVVKI